MVLFPVILSLLKLILKLLVLLTKSIELDSNEFTLKTPDGFKVIPPFVNVPSIVIFLIPVMSLFASTERISFSDAVPMVIPERRLSSSGVADIVVVDGEAKGTSVPELSARLIVLSAVGSITLRVVSKSSAVVPSNVMFCG